MEIPSYFWGKPKSDRKMKVWILTLVFSSTILIGCYSSKDAKKKLDRIKVINDFILDNIKEIKKYAILKKMTHKNIIGNFDKDDVKELSLINSKFKFLEILWKESLLTEDKISAFTIYDNGEIIYNIHDFYNKHYYLIYYDKELFGYTNTAEQRTEKLELHWAYRVNYD